MISVLKEIKPKNPILIAAWPGMGEVALQATRYLCKQLKAQPFAKLQTKKFFHQTDIAVKNGLLSLNTIADSPFYYWENVLGQHDLIIFISEFQPSSEKTFTYAQEILEFAARLGVQTVFTFAALLTSNDLGVLPQIWAAATDQKLMAEIQRYNVRPMASGQVSGLNGLFLGIAKAKKLKGACFLGEIPFYAVQIENPATSLRLLEAFSKFTGIKIDLYELSTAAKAMEEEIGRLVEYTQKSFGLEESSAPITADDIDRIKKTLEAQRQIPHSARRDIEELFLRAKNDVACALELKK